MAGSRRRGAALERAIREAAIAELRAAGYAGLTIEAVTERAGTGKAAVYRRWPTKRELVLDALRLLPDLTEFTLAGDVRTVLLALLTAFNDVLAGTAGLPGIDAIAELYRTPELRDAFVDQVVSPRLAVLQRALREAADRGEIAAREDVSLIARTGPALVLYSHLLTGAPASKDELARIVDDIVIPLLHPGAEQPRLAEVPVRPPSGAGR